MPASKRMINHDVIVEKSFVDLSDRAKVLYLYLNVNADNEGVVSTTVAMKTINASDDELEELIKAKYLIKTYGDRVIIRHWYMHNNLRADSKKSVYRDDLALVELLSYSRIYKEKSTEIVNNRLQSGEIEENSRLVEKSREEKKIKENRREENSREEFEEGGLTISQYIKNYCAKKSYKLEDGKLEGLVTYIQDVNKAKKLEIPDINSIIDRHFSGSSQK